MKSKLISSIYAVLTSLAFFLNYKGIFENNIIKINIFKVDLLVVLIVIFLLYKFYQKYYSCSVSKYKKFLCLLFSVFSVIGNSYMNIGSWDLVFVNVLMFSLTILNIIGQYILYKCLFSILDSFLNNYKIKDIKFKNKFLKKFLCYFEKHPFITSFIFIISCWLIYIIAFYPIILSPDPSFQIKQYFNEHTKYIDWVIRISPNINMTSHHPVFHTFLLGWCIELGRLILNDNFGLFIYSLIQVLSSVSVFSYTIVFSKKYLISNRLRFILLLIYSLVPVFPFYAMSAVKDTYYTIFMILYVMILFDIVKSYKTIKISLKYMIYIVIVIIFLTLFRNNGYYVVLFSFPLLLFHSKKNIFRFSFIFFIFFSFYQLYNNIIIPSLGISDGSIRETLSIPFQQTARVVKEHGDDLSNEEVLIIDKILGYDDLASRYDPEISDPVKNKYNKYTTNDDLKDYFKNVWWKEFTKYPDTYIEATLNNIYGYFYPNSTNWYIYYKYDNRVTENDLVNYHYNSLNSIRKVLSTYGVNFPYIPGVGLLVNIGFNTWLLLILASYLLEKNLKKYLIVLSPLFISVLVCIASPVNTYFRYAMPYIFVMPLIIGLIYTTLKKDM